MKFKKDKPWFKLGKVIGFFSAYIIFTVCLYFILAFTKKNLDLHYVAMITFSIAIIGLIVKRMLK